MPYKFNDNKDEDMNLAEDFPSVSRQLLIHMQQHFDIRKNISYVQTVEYLKGVQDVLDYLEFLYFKIKEE